MLLFRERNRRFILSIFISFLSAALIGCGQEGMQSISSQKLANNGNGIAGDLTPNPDQFDLDMDEAKRTTDDAARALEQAHHVVDKMIGPNGELTIDLNSVDSGQASAQFLFPGIPGVPDLKSKLDEVFNKIFDAIVKVDNIIPNLKQRIQDEMLKLDPLNPAHMALLVGMQELLTRLDQLQAKLDDVMDLLVDRIDFVIGKLDDLSAKFDVTDNPLYIIPVMLIAQVKASLVEFRNKVDAL